jgi:membrane protein DedA with SNARE-associated domain
MIFQLSNILSKLLVYRYPALFLITFAGSLGFPVPAGPATMASAAFAAQGYFSLFWVMVVGSLGNILGDITMYWLVRKFGRRVLLFLHLKKLADSPLLVDTEKTANAYKAPVILLSRFQVQATAIVNIIAGLGKMDFRRFFILVIIGEVAQMAFYVTIGYLFSDTWQSLYASMGKFSWIIALALAIIFTVAAAKIVNKKVG